MIASLCIKIEEIKICALLSVTETLNVKSRIELKLVELKIEKKNVFFEMGRQWFDNGQ